MKRSRIDWDSVKGRLLTESASEIAASLGVNRAAICMHFKRERLKQTIPEDFKTEKQKKSLRKEKPKVSVHQLTVKQSYDLVMSQANLEVVRAELQCIWDQINPIIESKRWRAKSGKLYLNGPQYKMYRIAVHLENIKRLLEWK